MDLAAQADAAGPRGNTDGDRERTGRTTLAVAASGRSTVRYVAMVLDAARGVARRRHWIDGGHRKIARRIGWIEKRGRGGRPIPHTVGDF
jgi:hypothetical protein